MADRITYFGQWLRQRRRSLDMTQTELAKLVGCSIVTIRKLELGERRPSRQIANALAQQLGIAEDEQEAFVRFARTDCEPERFQHPVFAEPLLPGAIPASGEWVIPEALFPADIPGWVRVGAADATPKLGRRILTARFHSAPIDSPAIMTLRDGRMLCKIAAMGRVNGDLQGTIRQEVTQLHVAPDQPDSFVTSAVLFHIETERGRLAGGAAGFMTIQREGAQERSRLQGCIYQTPEAYADLLLAEVIYEDEVTMAPNGIRDRGLLTLIPR